MAELRHLCMQCMHEIDRKETVCPYCGYSVGSKQLKPYLPQGIIIRGRYLVGKMIKRNIDSAVYIGSDIQLNKTVEIREFFPAKVSAREQDMVHVVASEGFGDIYKEYLQSFIQLWKNLMRFKGLPALFDVSEVFELNGTCYAVTDHNDSTTFRKILDTMDVENNPFSLKRTQTLIMSILSTVESLHTANVVHRGISPETLVLSSDGTLKITGFAIPQVRTTKNKIISSVCDGYAAIEQYDFNWQQGSWTDIYSIGALIYKMLTGRTLPPAHARLNDEEVFFTKEETERIPQNIIELIKGCLVLMPQGRMKDIHDIINVFSPAEASRKTVTAFKSRAVQREAKTEIKSEPVPVVRAAGAIISENQKLREKQEEEALKPKEIIKPRQAEAITKTSMPKNIVISEEQKLKEQQEAEREKRLREELYRKQQEEQEKKRIEDEKRRKQREEEIKQRNRENRRRKLEQSAAARAVTKANAKAGEISAKIKKKINRDINPVTLAVSIGVFVSVTCVLITFLLYGTVLYKYFDAPVLDNCLSGVSFLPVNREDDSENDVEYVSVADFSMLTREYIENDALLNKRYKIVFEYDYCDTVEKGYVFSQSVSAGEKVPIGTEITVYISKGIEMLTFIDVKGMQYDEAEKALTDIGFVVTKKEIYNIGIYTQNKVISTDLTVGEEYPRGTAVTLSVWSAPPVTLPSTTENQSPSQQTPQNDDRDFFSFWRDILGF